MCPKCKTTRVFKDKVHGQYGDYVQCYCNICKHTWTEPVRDKDL
jgi:hypothetical protein